MSKGIGDAGGRDTAPVPPGMAAVVRNFLDRGLTCRREVRLQGAHLGKSFRSAPAVRGAPGLAAAGALALAALLPTVAPAGERETAGGAEFDSPDIELSGPEVYKLDHATHSLRAADVDDDGRTDLLLVNNSKARIEVLLQNTPERMREDAAKAERDPDDPNRLGDPFRFRREPFLTEKGVTSFVVADVTGDGRPDLVYFGDRELCVAPGEKSGKFAKARTFRVQDGSPARDALAIGDVNGDGRADIVLLGERSTYIFHQDGKGGISDPVAMANVSREIQGIFLADATGDGRADLFLLAPSAERCLLMREQKPGGGFSADVGFNVGKYRALAQARLSAGAKASGILAIHQVTGMVKAMALGIAPDGKEGKGANAGKPRFGRIRFHPLLESKEGGDRSFVMADIGGRGALDVLATDPGGARIALYRRGKGERGGFGAPQYYPMPTGISDICAGDFNGDGRIEIAVCSPKESSIGIAGEEASGRVSYPKPVPGVKGKPFAAAAADFNGDGKTDLAYAAADASSHLVGVMIQKDGAFV
ncbi:MAG: VCBS repeat-containing protein, partial [Planctomycetota bacterium]|nr:VCBS repeat-containing protein [Planctomycetota bacterium]